MSNLKRMVRIGTHIASGQRKLRLYTVANKTEEKSRGFPTSGKPW